MLQRLVAVDVKCTMHPAIGCNVKKIARASALTLSRNLEDGHFTPRQWSQVARGTTKT